MKKKLDKEIDACDRCEAIESYLNRCYVCEKVFCYECINDEESNKRELYSFWVSHDERFEIVICPRCKFSEEVKALIDEFKQKEDEVSIANSRMEKIVKKLKEIGPKKYDSTIRNGKVFDDEDDDL